MDYRKFRKQIEIGREDLATMLHVSYKTIANWEQGKSTPLPVFQKEMEKIIQESKRA